MPSAVVASSVRQALHRITAKDRPVLGIPKLSLPVSFSDSIPIPSGKFWDSDSDSVCEDLGDAEALALAQRTRLPQAEIQTGLQQPPTPPATKRHTAWIKKPIKKPEFVPKRIHVPWGRTWKGPLPPRRSTAVLTLGDFLPAIAAAHLSDAGAGANHGRDHDGGDSKKKEFQFSKSAVGLRSHDRVQTHRGPSGSADRSLTRSQDGSDRVFIRPKRRLVNLAAFSAFPSTHLLQPPNQTSPLPLPPTQTPTSSSPCTAPPTYLEVLMAGRGRSNRGRNSSGRGVAYGGRGNQAPSRQGGPGHAPQPAAPGMQAPSGAEVQQAPQAGGGQQPPARGRAQQARGGKPRASQSETAVTYCGAAEDEGGFFHIQAARPGSVVASNQFPMAALITVESGDMSARLLNNELSRIIPVNWNWEMFVLDAIFIAYTSNVKSLSK
ncbi:hypothetical protein BS78_07G008200 [Paspalum vaginatum]|nr:hypothetical protein BS78_07G008200 [Paspalum vaginatum]